MLPFGYAVRNLFRDRARLLQTVAGSAVVVLLVMGAFSLNDGMRRLLSATGSPRNVILLGAGSEESVQRSEVPPATPGIAEASLRGLREKFGTRAVSPEIHYMTYLEAEGAESQQALFRGVAPPALLVHPEVRLVEGRFPGPGELLAGRLAWRKLGLARDALREGARVRVDGAGFRISGVFAAPGTVMESEIWADLNDLRTLAQRETLSCVVLRLEEAEFADVDLFTRQRLDLELAAVPETTYYERLSAFYAPLRGMTWVTAALIATGAVFGGLNTLYAAFASRIREMAALQVIGFGRGALLLSLTAESLLACLAGTLAASAAAVWILDGLTVTFSVGSFVLRVTPGVALAGLVTGVVLGLIGVLPPAWRCLLPPLPAALRSG